MSQTFTHNIARLAGLGFNLNQSLNIIARFNKHIETCVNGNQDYDETLFYVAQDFSFEPQITEAIMLDCILSEKKYTEYFN
jgi:hypothetical protein